MKKLTKTAKGLDIFFKISFGLIIIVCSSVVLTDVAMFIFGEQIIQPENLNMIIFHFNGIHITSDMFAHMNLLKYFTMITVIFIIASIIGLYGIIIIRQMLQPMKEGKPFDVVVSKSFKQLGWLSIIFGIIKIMISYIVQNILVRNIQTLNNTYTFDSQHIYNGSFVFVTILFFLFSYIFCYGEELQKQADETL